MFELRVLSGYHCGAALPLSGASWCIGGDPQADLRLDGVDLAGLSYLLGCDDGVWRLSAEPASQETWTLEVDTPFQLADVWLCVARAETPWHEAAALLAPAEASPTPSEASPAPPPVVRRRLSSAMRGLVLGLFLLLSITVASWILQPTMAQTSAGEGRTDSWNNVEELRAPLQQQLRERELLKQIRISKQGDGLLLSGELSKPQMAVFERMMAHFYAHYGAAAPVRIAVRPQEKKLPFRIVQVTTGQRANIVTEDGQRVFIGDEIAGLRLAAITDDQIEFSGRDPLTVKW
ncbi:EscD/YscD/HrpQ family type III secretion system periplasmic domain-containing protein [Serratia ficaria]|uniref:EscD/YscD/HrpQ family type III secretion system periplasmic domain-containing protein n=1 Tax=Serratia ficaria TaxID=61651 RepID=UPI00077C28EF|nr:EscD/YscD/HrpQ family type III secretion system periplasmic domain-containing protein [Serratia ficaria]